MRQHRLLRPRFIEVLTELPWASDNDKQRRDEKSSRQSAIQVPSFQSTPVEVPTPCWKFKSMRLRCDYCQSECDQGAERCPSCGPPVNHRWLPALAYRRCPYCIRKLLALASPACSYCGRRL